MDLVRTQVFVQVRTHGAEHAGGVVHDARNDVVVGPRDHDLVGLGKVHDALGHVDAVTDHADTLVGVMHHAHRPQVQSDAYRKHLAVLLQQQPAQQQRRLQRLLGVAEKADGDAIAGVHHDARGFGHALERLEDQFVEALPERHLLIHRMFRGGHQIQKHHGAQHIPAQRGGCQGRSLALRARARGRRRVASRGYETGGAGCGLLQRSPQLRDVLRPAALARAQRPVDGAQQRLAEHRRIGDVHRPGHGVVLHT